MVKEVKRPNGLVFTVDDEDYERVSKCNWYTYRSKDKSTVYIRCFEHSSLAKFILNAKDEKRNVERIDGNPFNYQKNNLRFIDGKGIAVKAKAKSNSTSTYKGVYWDKSKSRWRAAIRVNGKRTYLGNFTNEHDAALAYNTAALEYFGKEAYQNVIN